MVFFFSSKRSQLRVDCWNGPIPRVLRHQSTTTTVQHTSRWIRLWRTTTCSDGLIFHPFFYIHFSQTWKWVTSADQKSSQEAGHCRWPNCFPYFGLSNPFYLFIFIYLFIFYFFILIFGLFIPTAYSKVERVQSWKYYINIIEERLWYPSWSYINF